MRKSTLLLWVLMLALSMSAIAQNFTVTGKVSDDNNQPLVAATVQEKGTSHGVITGPDGSFSISVKSNKSVLVISSLGFETVEVSASSNDLRVSLKVDTKSLNEVVVTGVGVATSKKKLGISVESIGSDKLPATPTASIDQALIGKVPGAQISTVSGNPGDPVNIVLRGINTVQGGTFPIVLLDGVQVGATNLNSLDLNNIDRVEIVQGAASASIYGAQGANGVIQIFTKKGRKGALAINYSTSYSFNSYINSGDVHKARTHPYLTDNNNNIVDVDGNVLDYTDYGAIEGISYEFPTGAGATRYAILDPNNVADNPYNANLKYYDQFKQVFQTGTTFNNSLSVSGGGDKSDYALTVSNSHAVSPVMKNGYDDRTNFTSNIGVELFKNFKFRSITELIYTKNTLVPGLGSPGGLFYGLGNRQGNVGNIYGFLNTSPFFDLTRKDADGNYPNYQLADFLSVNATDPFYVQQYNSGLDNKIDLIQNFGATYKLNKFVELDARYGINYRTETARWTYHNQSENLNSEYYGVWTGVYAPDNTGEIDNWHYTTTFQNFLATANIKVDAQKDLHMKIPLQSSTQISFDYRKNKYSEYDTYGTGLPIAPPINMSSTSVQAVALDYVQPFITYGYLVNEKLDIGDWGGVGGGFRSDYSSAFGGGSKPFTFPHIDGYINIAGFDFWNGMSATIPYLKIRSAYGEAGIQPGPFDRYPTLSQANLGDALTYSLKSIQQNPDLNVEVSKEFEAGTDFTVNLNKSRSWFSAINGSFTYWKRTSHDVIYNVSIAPSNGGTGRLTNAIDMHSDGYQFQVNIPVCQSTNFSWDFTVNFGHQVSIIDAIEGGADIILVSAAGSTGLVLTPGQKIGQIYGYRALTSIDQLRQDGKTPYLDPSIQGNYVIVDGRVVDPALKNMIFTDDTYPLGDPNPKFNASFINSLTYKGFVSLGFQFDWVSGSHLYNQTKEWMYRDGISGDFENPVTINGQTGAYSAYWASAYYNLLLVAHGPGNNATKDYFYEDASFVRLRNVSLAFNIDKIVNIKHVDRLQLILTGRNILTFTNYTGFDPEISSGFANSAFDRGIDHSTIPNLKSYQIGLNIGL